jgi:hypothetical protein
MLAYQEPVQEPSAQAAALPQSAQSDPASLVKPTSEPVAKRA